LAASPPPIFHSNGDELYARTRLLDPELADRFVFTSGGATDARFVDFLAEVPNERLDKPFNVQNLRGIVRRVVNSRPQER